MKQRQSLVPLRPSAQPSRLVEVVDPQAHVVYGDWLGVLDWQQLELLASCTASEVGFGHELAFSIYDDDGDAAAEPFEGVRITATYRDGEHVVVSRRDYDRIVGDVCDIARARPPAPLPPWWPEFLAHAQTIADRADRA